MTPEAYRRRTVDWRYWNTLRAIKRCERTLTNSMAHIQKPRPVDMIRWRKLAQQIATLKAKAEAIRPGEPDANA